MQSSFQNDDRLHVAAIMDGNGRWATARGLTRPDGHREGAKAVRRVAEAAPDLGVGTLTLYAFSSDNWRRPRTEVTAIMALVADFFRSEISTCRKRGVRMSVIGRRDRLPTVVRAAARAAERATRGGTALHMRVALDYSSRDAILRATRKLAGTPNPTREDFDRALRGDVPDVDLLIRTGGEQRLSDFLLWESAYAEFLFTPRLWPDFRGEDLAEAVRDFEGRERRFGAVPGARAIG